MTNGSTEVERYQSTGSLRRLNRTGARMRSRKISNPLLTFREQRAVGIHECAEVGEARGEVWEGMEAKPGEQEAGADKGLQ